MSRSTEDQASTPVFKNQDRETLLGLLISSSCTNASVCLVNIINGGLGSAQAQARIRLGRSCDSHWADRRVSGTRKPRGNCMVI
ncbi:hypothetical protein SISSUDRAFT_417868 [Sistotremastrum suecicum HHB10207 ss-3]|uniref:Uncharacterized protein n=1 Tax=Sistotremastrum suecicum HHB10207 ss-3 TaxID=1314776 RepID=A0A165YM48_9AGAM|nr:hypothetical protein SISSUDRAFT_417868 [Sistotremastrum suecicum HHB10207 ss-3]